jgi:hypothetical protein
MTKKLVIGMAKSLNGRRRELKSYCILKSRLGIRNTAIGPAKFTLTKQLIYAKRGLAQELQKCKNSK